MGDLVKLGAKAELPVPGEAKEITCGDRTLCVANVDGTLAALDNICVHRGGPLGQGIVDSGKIVCPWHGWAYDPKSGAAAHNANMKVNVYPLTIEGDNVMIDI